MTDVVAASRLNPDDAITQLPALPASAEVSTLKVEARDTDPSEPV